MHLYTSSTGRMHINIHIHAHTHTHTHIYIYISHDNPDNVKGLINMNIC